MPLLNDLNLLRRLTYFARLWAGSKFSGRLLPSQVRPIAASIKLTENCQARCVTCDYWKTRSRDQIDTEHAIALINRLSAFGIRYLRFEGGEPLLRQDLFEVLDHADTSRFKRITLQTNGLLLKKRHKEINVSPITKVSVSVDGLQATNDVIRGVRGYFKLAFEGLQMIEGKEIQVITTLNKKSAGELERLVELVQNFGFNFSYNILDDRLYFFRNTDISPLWPEDEDIRRIVKVLRVKLKRPENEVRYVEQYFEREGLQEPPCYLGFIQLFVQSNGDVWSGCYVLPPMGNVLTQDSEEIVFSQAYYDRCVGMLHRECPGCTCGVIWNIRANSAIPLFQNWRSYHGLMQIGTAPRQSN